MPGERSGQGPGSPASLLAGAGWTAFLIVTAALAALALLVLLTLEWANAREPWGYLVLAVGLAGLAGTWGWRVRVAVRRGQPGVLALGLVGLGVAAFPLILVLPRAVATAYHAVRTVRFERSASAVEYRDRPIVWPGFDGPVGLHVEFRVQGAVTLRGAALAPKLVVTSGEESTRRVVGDPTATLGDCLTRAFDRLPCLRVPATPDGGPRSRPAAAVSERVVADLYPHDLAYLDGPDRLCLEPEARMESGSACGRPVLLWAFDGEGGPLLLGAVLAEAVRTRSVLVREPCPLEAMRARLRPDSLLARGYGSCRLDAASRVASDLRCFCRAPAPAGQAGGTTP